jgi:hypothetical protein
MGVVFSSVMLLCACALPALALYLCIVRGQSIDAFRRTFIPPYAVSHLSVRRQVALALGLQG